jgi:hypothetical protein
MRVAGLRAVVFMLAGILLAPGAQAQSSHESPSSSSASKHAKGAAKADLDRGWISNGFYRNSTLGLTCKIPEAWVLRTDEVNAPDEQEAKDAGSGTHGGSGLAGRVLLATFSRPPDARAVDVNASILIAAENVESYPGLKDAAQYFGPLTEVAKAQGFMVDEEPYEIALDNKTLVRGDFHKDVGTRVMHQSTLAMLSHGYAVSITVIGGTDDEVEDLIDGISFTAGKK